MFRKSLFFLVLKADQGPLGTLEGFQDQLGALGGPIDDPVRTEEGNMLVAFLSFEGQSTYCTYHLNVTQAIRQVKRLGNSLQI